VHHTGSEADVESLAPDVQRIVGEARHVFGEYPAFDGGTYTFIADYLPWANGDGMEHRNSTIVTSASSIRSNRFGLLDTIAHEFFHAWNVERIRPRSLEPFNFDDANMSGELWLAEGFTSYYGPLVLLRAGVTQIADFAAELTDTLNTVLNSPGRLVRSAEDMSRLAPFVDAAVWMDRTSFENTYISYYSWGEAIGLGLDLTLRDRSNGEITLDHFMRALWQLHGKPGGAPGIVDRPYTPADLRRTLGAVAGDESFANDFFDRFVEGREVVDYQRLLDRVGFALRSAAPGQGFAGQLRLQDAQGGVRVVGSVPLQSPAYAAGLERDDVIAAVDGRSVQSAVDVERAIRAHKPGDEMSVLFDRRGQRVTGRIRIIADPRVEVVPVESTGRQPTAEQRRLRDAWLSSGARNTI
jgi:predicted metalloprotease with PDZ domain